MGSRLLLRLTENVNVPARLVSSVRNVEATRHLADSSDLSDLLGGKVDLLEVLNDTVGSDRLGNDAVATNLRPVEDDLSGGDGLAGALGSLLGDFLDLGAGYQQRHANHVVTEGLSY